MDLTTITFFAFQEKHRQIHDLLSNRDRYKTLLNEARRELPIVDGLLGLLSEVNTLPEDKQDAVFNRILQDVHMVLTLWSLARPAGATEQRSESAPASTTESHLRLRRFGMN